MEIEFQGQFSQPILYKAFYLVYKPSKRNMIYQTGLFSLYIGFIVIVIIGVANQDSPSKMDILNMGRLLFSLPFIVYVFLRPYISIYTSALKIWKDPLTQKNLSGLISNQSVRYTFSTGGDLEIAWEKFVKMKITEDLMVLLTAEGLLSFFPCQFFKSEDDWKKAQQIAKFKVIEAV